MFFEGELVFRALSVFSTDAAKVFSRFCSNKIPVYWHNNLVRTKTTVTLRKIGV